MAHVKDSRTLSSLMIFLKLTNYKILYTIYIYKINMLSSLPILVLAKV